MKILVLGASGACGRWVTRLGAERGHQITAVVRPHSVFAVPEGTTLVQGQVLQSDFLDPLFATHDAAISCLGLRRSSVLPWSKLHSPPDLVQQAARVVAESPSAAALQRFVWISAGGVGASRAQSSALVKLMIGLGNVGVAYQDLEKAEAILDGSPVRSLAVRPVTLVSGSPKRKRGPVDQYRMLSTIRRSEVAQFLLDVVDGNGSIPDRHVLLG